MGLCTGGGFGLHYGGSRRRRNDQWDMRGCQGNSDYNDIVFTTVSTIEGKLYRQNVMDFAVSKLTLNPY